jgi:hypothetical protein
VAWAALASALVPHHQPAAAAAYRRAALYATGEAELPLPAASIAAVADVARGVQALRNGEYALAVDEFERQLRRTPRRRDLRLFYVEALRRTGALGQAREVLAQLGSAQSTALPYVWLVLALDADHAPASMRAIQERGDPGDRHAIAFFAPEPVPWQQAGDVYVALDGRQLQPIRAFLRPVVAPDLPDEPSPAPQPKHAGREEGAIDDLLSLAASRVRDLARLRPNRKQRYSVPARPAAVSDLHVLVTASEPLRQLYGEAGAQQVMARLQVLAGALNDGDRQCAVVDCNNPATLAMHEHLAGLRIEPGAVGLVSAIRRIASRHEAVNGTLRTVVLVGGDQVLPFVRLPNSVPDGDNEVCSDLPYGCDSPAQVVPNRLVTRLPDGGDLRLLLRQLDRMATHYQAEARRGRAPRRVAERALIGSYSAEVWRDASAAVLEAAGHGGVFPTCPPTTVDHAGALVPAHVLYYNLHGAESSANWYGQARGRPMLTIDHLPIGCTPQRIGRMALDGAILVSEACYGMELARRTPAHSVPLAALEAGVAACIGSTVNAYGSTSAPLVAADLLMAELLRLVMRGMPVGQAFVEARAAFADAMQRRQGYLDEVDLKTLQSFVLYGDPWAVVETSAKEPARKAVPTTPTVPLRRRLGRIVGERDIIPTTIRTARARLARLVTPEAARTLTIRSFTNGAREGAKGHADETLTFSAHDVTLASDGHYVTQAAHVTLRGNEIVKEVVTH